MIAFLMIAAGFPVVAVAIVLVAYPFLIGLFLTNWAEMLLSILNSSYRTVIGFIDSFIPLSWQYGEIIRTEYTIAYEDPTAFTTWFWYPISSFQLPTHDEVWVVVSFMAVVWSMEIYILLKLLKKRVQAGGGVPEVAEDISIMGKTRDRH